MKPWKLRSSLVLLLVATTLTTFLLLGGSILLYRLPQAAEVSRETAQREARDIANLLEYYLGSIRAQLNPTVAFLRKDRPLEEIQAHLDAIVGDGILLEAIYVVSADGAIEAVGLPPVRQGRRADLQVGDLSSNRLFRAARDSGTIVWSDKYLSAMTGGLTVGIAIPADDRMVVAEISPRSIVETAQAMSRHTQHFVLVVDSRGEWIADNTQDSQNVLHNWAGHPAVQAALHNFPSPDTVQFQGAAYHAGHAISPQLGWVFVVGTPAGMNNPVLRSSVLLVFGAFFGALLIGGLLAPLWANQMERPLRVLMTRIRRLAQGDYGSQHVADTRIAEFKDLLADMDRMAQAIQERQNEIRRTAERLKESEYELEAIFNASPVAMSVSDVDEAFRVVTVNDAWERQFGRRREEVRGFNGAEIGLWVDDQNRRSFLAQIQAKGSVDDLEAPLARRDGKQLVCRISGRIVASDSRRLLVMVQENITEQRRIEQEIRDLNADLEQRVQLRTEDLERANKELAETLQTLRNAQNELVRSENLAALGRLVAGVAHELNTPIGNGLMAATTFRDQLDEFRKSAADGLRRNAFESFLDNAATASDILVRNLERGAGLITSFKRLAVDQSSAQRRRFMLAETVEETLSILRPTTKRTPYRFETDIPADIELDSFPGSLEQVLTNLINNAILHGFEGRDHGRVLITAERLDADHVRLAVEDDGKGIAAAQQSHIFEPFFTTKLGRGGSGLGLHVSRSAVINILGGDITFQSGEHGTRFEITLPLIAPAAAPEMTSARAIVGK